MSKKKIIDFPNLRQTFNYDCGAKALESVLVYFGKDVRGDRIMKKAKTSRSGTSVDGLIDTIKSFKLKHKAGKMSIDNIKFYIDNESPVILVLQAWADKNVNWENNWNDGHYVVAIGYDDEKIFFEDPSSHLRTYLKNDELLERWHDVGENNKKYVNYGIAVFGEKKYNSKTIIHMD